MGYYCCANKCNSSEDKRKNLVKYPWMKNITFHTFPRKKNKRLIKQWISMASRENWEPNRHTRICSIHFVGLRGPTVKHPTPTLFDYGGLLSDGRKNVQGQDKRDTGDQNSLSVVDGERESMRP